MQIKFLIVLLDKLKQIGYSNIIVNLVLLCISLLLLAKEKVNMGKYILTFTIVNIVFLILNLMFEIELRKNKQFTLVLDDVSDSFDYKNNLKL